MYNSMLSSTKIGCSENHIKFAVNLTTVGSERHLILCSESLRSDHHYTKIGENCGKRFTTYL